MDTSGISRITPLEIGGFVLQKKSHFAEEGYATKCIEKKARLMDIHHLVPLDDGSNPIDHRIFI